MALSGFQSRLLKAEPGVRLAVETALIVALALVIARMIWLAVSPQDAVAAYTERPLPTMATEGVQRIEADVSLLVRSNPFEGTGSVAEIEEDVVETQLNLRLIGLRADTGPSAGTATIILPNNQQQKFAEGEEILPGVLLRRVASDRVILSRNGVDEVLRLNNRSGRLSVIGNIETVEDAEPRLERRAQQPPPAPATVQISGPEALLSAISLREARSNGRVLGYRIEPIGSLSRLQDLGFQAGDILVRVNGQSVVDQDFAEVFDTIGSYSEALLDIDRSGRAIQVIFEIGE
ncbi:MAG: type II secretion system protein N [Pseudomonadota bacterium]